MIELYCTECEELISLNTLGRCPWCGDDSHVVDMDEYTDNMPEDDKLALIAMIGDKL